MIWLNLELTLWARLTHSEKPQGNELGLSALLNFADDKRQCKSLGAPGDQGISTVINNKKSQQWRAYLNPVSAIIQ